MFDCAKDVRAYHDQDVTLPKTEQDAMRDRRNSNRTRLRNGLAAAGKPAPHEFVKQGSYAMKTMVRDPDNDYDIDDGVYFRKEDLVGERGAVVLEEVGAGGADQQEVARHDRSHEHL